MRAILTSLGSTGDIEPFLALALELQRHGHAPLLALPPTFMPRAARLGIPCAPVGPALDQATLRTVGAHMLATTRPADQVRQFLRVLLPALPRMLDDLAPLCQQADVLIGPPFQPACQVLHETIGLPFVSIHLSQFGALGSKAVREVSAPPINQFRLSHGLAPLPDPLGADGVSSELALYAVSARVLRRPAHWPAHHHVTGYFFLDQPDWEPEPELSAFLAAGSPPIAISFGSMIHSDSAGLTELLLQAIARVGCRAIIQRGWSGLARHALPANVYSAGFTPHGWLFPRVACVVHHGGAGTTAATLRAGVPTVVVPHMLDQPIWGEFARALGCASMVIPFAELTAEQLSAGIDSARAPERQQRAAAVGARIRAEQGVRTARQLIEQCLAASATREQP